MPSWHTLLHSARASTHIFSLTSVNSSIKRTLSTAPERSTVNMPTNNTNNNNNNNQLRLPPIRRIDAVYLTTTTAEERAILLRELNDSFKHTTLTRLPFYHALSSYSEGEPGADLERYTDTAIVNMINNYPVHAKKERLVKIFSQYQNGERITDPSVSQQQVPQVQHQQQQVHVPAPVIPQRLNRPGIPKLNDIVPGLNDQIFPKPLLDQITQSRQNLVAEYLDELKASAKHHPRLQNPHALEHLAQLLTQINNQSNSLISIDIEAHEHSQDTVTEIGISIYDPSREATSIFPSFKNIHILPEEYIRLRNGSFVADNKDKFLGGSSIILPLEKSVQLIQCLVDYYFIHRTELGLSGILVGHNVSGDVKWLERLGVEFPSDMKIVDTQTLYGITHGQNNSSLGGILRRFDVPHSYLHNAGNDAYYTLILAMKLGDPQFRRWKAVDSYKEDEAYLEKLEQRKQITGDPFKGSRPSKPRSAKAKKNNEFIAPVKYGSSVAALAEMFKLSDL